MTCSCVYWFSTVTDKVHDLLVLPIPSLGWNINSGPKDLPNCSKVTSAFPTVKTKDTLPCVTKAASSVARDNKLSVAIPDAACNVSAAARSQHANIFLGRSNFPPVIKTASVTLVTATFTKLCHNMPRIASRPGPSANGLHNSRLHPFSCYFLPVQIVFS